MKESVVLWSYLIPAITFGFAAAAQPGPLMLYLISKTLQTGWRRTFPAIFAPLVTDGPIAVICLLILGSLPPGFLLYIQAAGGIFILFLAYNAAKTWKMEPVAKVLKASSTSRTLLDATVVNVLNPGPWLGWSLIVGPLFVEGWKANPGFGISVIAGFYLMMFAITAGVVILFDLARDRGPRLQRVLLGLSAVFLALFGIYQLVTAILKFLK